MTIRKGSGSFPVVISPLLSDVDVVDGFGLIAYLHQNSLKSEALFKLVQAYYLLGVFPTCTVHVWHELLEWAE